MTLKSHHISRAMTLFYIAVFFTYLFGPLIVMAITAFNSSEFPRISPWECFSSQWFERLMEDERLVIGFQRSLFIGVIVTVLSILLGLAGALMLMEVPGRVRSAYYTILISPILIPGVVLGISTLIFWDRIRIFLGFGADSLFYDGVFLTILGQTTFIASYCMLIFIARLQRFDRSLEEAALDLGATHVQSFTKVLIPFLKPAFGSAAVIAFLASFENYNTTVFTILSKSTLTTELASKVRYGINPSISALAVIIISLTLCGAICYEILKRREERHAALRAAAAKQAERMELAGQAQAAVTAKVARKPFDVSVASVAAVLIIFAGIGTFFMSNSYPNGACQAALQQEKLQRQQELEAQRNFEIQQQLELEKFLNNNAEEAPAESAPDEEGGAFDGIFNQNDSQEQGEGGAFQGIFAPDNLTE